MLCAEFSDVFNTLDQIYLLFTSKNIFLALSLSGVVFIMLINVKMPTIVGILTFMSGLISYSAELSMEKVL